LDKDFKKKLQNINPRGLKCTCYRAIAKQYDDPLSTKGNEKVSGRWHIKGEFNALYLCDSKIIYNINDYGYCQRHSGCDRSGQSAKVLN